MALGLLLRRLGGLRRRRLTAAAAITLRHAFATVHAAIAIPVGTATASHVMALMLPWLALRGLGMLGMRGGRGLLLVALVLRSCRRGLGGSG